MISSVFLVCRLPLGGPNIAGMAATSWAESRNRCSSISSSKNTAAAVFKKNKRNKKRRRSFAPKKAENLPQTSRLPQATTKIRASDQKFHNLSMSAGLMSRSCGGCFPGFGHQWGFPWFTHCLQMSSNDWGSDQNLSDFGAVYFKQPHHLGNESWLCLCREKPAYWDECRRVWNGIQYFLPWALHK